MALDRWIALIFLLVCVLYGYTAFVTMQEGLLPFERNMAFLPNSLPKGLAILGGLIALVILIAPKPADNDEKAEIDLRRFGEYKVAQALFMLLAMVLYAIALRPLGFLASTFIFIVGCSFVLGERRPVPMVLAAGLGAAIVWYLVDQVLGIFLRPLPIFMTGVAG